MKKETWRLGGSVSEDELQVEREKEEEEEKEKVEESR